MRRYTKRRKNKPHVYSGHCEVCGASEKLNLISHLKGNKFSPFMCPVCAYDYVFRKFIAPRIIESWMEAK